MHGCTSGNGTEYELKDQCIVEKGCRERERKKA